MIRARVHEGSQILADHIVIQTAPTDTDIQRHMETGRHERVRGRGRVKTTLVMHCWLSFLNQASWWSHPYIHSKVFVSENEGASEQASGPVREAGGAYISFDASMAAEGLRPIVHAPCPPCPCRARAGARGAMSVQFRARSDSVGDRKGARKFARKTGEGGHGEWLHRRIREDPSKNSGEAFAGVLVAGVAVSFLGNGGPHGPLKGQAGASSQRAEIKSQ